MSMPWAPTVNLRLIDKPGGAAPGARGSSEAFANILISFINEKSVEFIKKVAEHSEEWLKENIQATIQTRGKGSVRTGTTGKLKASIGHDVEKPSGAPGVGETLSFKVGSGFGGKKPATDKKGRRYDGFVEKGTEPSPGRFIPIHTLHTITDPKGEKVQWQESFGDFANRGLIPTLTARKRQVRYGPEWSPARDKKVLSLWNSQAAERAKKGYGDSEILFMGKRRKPMSFSEVQVHHNIPVDNRFWQTGGRTEKDAHSQHNLVVVTPLDHAMRHYFIEKEYRAGWAQRKDVAKELIDSMDLTRWFGKGGVLGSGRPGTVDRARMTQWLDANAARMAFNLDARMGKGIYKDLPKGYKHTAVDMKGKRKTPFRMTQAIANKVGIKDIGVHDGSKGHFFTRRLRDHLDPEKTGAMERIWKEVFD